MLTSVNDDDWQSHNNWSDRERQHQRERHKRKAVANRAAAVQQSQQPGVYVSINQPDRISSNPWPTLPQVRSYLASTYQAWRVLTSGGDHAEFYLERAEQAARGSEQHFKEQMAALMCDEPKYITAEEKLGSELFQKFPEHMQKNYAILRDQRRQEKLPAFMGRQMLCLGLRKFSKDEVRDQNSARNSLNALRNSVKKGPPQRNQFRMLVQAIRQNFTLESA